MAEGSLRIFQEEERDGATVIAVTSLGLDGLLMMQSTANRTWVAMLTAITYS